MNSLDLVRLLGGTYLGEFCDIKCNVAQLTAFNINPWLIAQYVQATTVGCPNPFIAETTSKNAEVHQKMGNHSSVSTYITKVMATITKEHSNRYNIPLPNWITRYLPHCFITPQHALKKPDKAM
jgi:hypothetical protein